MEIRFGTEGWRGQIADTFTISNARLVCQAFAEDLKERGLSEQGVVIGYDTRFLSDRFAKECAQVLAANGITVFLLDSVTPTPLLSFAVRYLGAASGLMVTASHNPSEWNGLKWKGAHAGPVSETDIRRMAAKVGGTPVQTAPFADLRTSGLIRYANCDEPYFAHMMRFLQPNRAKQRKLHVVVDAMHGAAGAYFAKALTEIGCTVTAIRSRPDPKFGGVHPEPIQKNLLALQEKVLEVHADLGLATDGDGDRLGAVDAQGRFVSPQILFSLLTWHLLRERGWKGSVVKTFSTTKMIDSIAQNYAVPVREVPIGFKHICERMQREEVLIGGEESGGIGIPRHMPERDGIFAGLLLVEHLLRTERSLSDAVQDLMKLTGVKAYDRLDVPLTTQKKEQLQKSLQTRAKTFAGVRVADIQTTDGLKYVLQDGSWVLFRMSGTEPLLRVYAEAKSEQEVARYLEAAKQMVDGMLLRV